MNCGTWRGDSTQKKVYLTFDDGPIPEQTPWVIKLLQQYNIKATFFCVGDNIRKHPDVFQMLISNGHSIGNHTFNHLQLLKNSRSFYFDNIEKCSSIAMHPKLFRPPHGQIMPWHIRKLLKSFDKVVFWDVMPKDYDQDLTPEQVFDNVRKYVRNGSIIVFHDSLKSGERMRFALKNTIEMLKNDGFEFGLVEDITKN